MGLKEYPVRHRHVALPPMEDGLHFFASTTVYVFVSSCLLTNFATNMPRRFKKP